MGIRETGRAGARAVLGPVWRRVWARIENRLRPTEQRLDQLDAAWTHHVPAFLNAVSTVGAFGFELVALRRRIEAMQARVASHDTAFEELGRPNLDLKSAGVGAPLAARLASLGAASEEFRAQIGDLVETLRAFSAQLATLRGQTDAMQTETSGLATRSQQFDSALSEFGVLGTKVSHLANEIGRLSLRIEFIRSETLYEIQYGDGNAPVRAGAPPAFIEPGKLELLAPDPKVNLGCGHLPLDGFVNVDRRPLPGVDIVAEVDAVPIEPASLAEIYSAHLLEHFPQEALRRKLLPYWRRLLRPGGLFRAVVPDGEAMLAGLSSGSYPFEEFRLVLFGAQDYIGDFHYNLLTPDSLRALLEEAGFIDIDIPVRGRRNGSCFEFEIIGRKPTGNS